MEETDKKLPSVSIVIPAYNEAAVLATCLKHVMNQDYQGVIEVIVVDNASNDNTPLIAKNYGAKVVYEPHVGVVYARIAGFNNATHAIIASTDADTLVPSNWVSSIAKDLSNPKYDGLAGAYSLCSTNTLPKKVVQFLIPLFRTIDRAVGAHFAGANFAIKKQAYEEIGGFSTDFETGEDLDLSYRLRKSGHSIKVDYSIKVLTSARRLNEGFWYTFTNYMLKNWCSLVFLHHPYLKKLPAVREVVSDIEDVNVA